MRRQLATIALILLLLLGLVAPFSALAGLMLLAVIGLVTNLIVTLVRAAVLITIDEPDPPQVQPAPDHAPDSVGATR